MVLCDKNQDNNIDNKIIMLLNEIENGNNNAKTELGEYYNSLGFEQYNCDDPNCMENALVYFQKSYELGNQHGKTNFSLLLNYLGVCYYKGGDYFQVDYNKAEYYFLQALKVGNENAKENLALLYNQYGKQYRDGKGVKKNNQFAESFFKKSISMGSKEAKYNLMNAYINGYFNYFYGVNGYVEDIDKANELLQKAKNADNEILEVIANNYYEEAKVLVGQGIDKKSYHKINSCLKKASMLGLTGINQDLITFYKYVSNCYKKGKKGFKKDKYKANYYMGKAAELGDDEAIKKYKQK